LEFARLPGFYSSHSKGDHRAKHIVPLAPFARPVNTGVRRSLAS